MANKIFGALDTLGGAGGSGSLDEILQSTLTDGDLAIVVDIAEEAYIYRYESSFDTSVATGTPETDPQVVAPNDQADDTGAWILSDMSVEDLKAYGNFVLDGTLLATGLITATAGIDITGYLTFDSGTQITSVDEDLSDASADHTTLASAKAIKTEIDSKVSGLTTNVDLLAGWINRAKFTWVDTDTITVGPARYHLKGTAQGENIYKWDTDLTIDFGALGVSEWQYLYIDDSALADDTTALTATEFFTSTSAPVWDADELGWYSFDDRCIGAFYADSGGTLMEFHHDGGDLWSYRQSFTDNNSAPGTGFATSVTLSAPTFCTAAHVAHRLYPTSTTTFLYGYYRPTGQTNSTGIITGAMRRGNDPFSETINEFKTFCSTGQSIDIRTSGADAHAYYYVYTNGYYFPKGM